MTQANGGMPDNEQNQNDTDHQEGSNTQNNQGIDWSTVNVADIPVDVIKQHTEYKKVLDESIDRRKQISNMKQQGTNKPADNTVKKDGEQNKDDNPLAQQLEAMQSVLNQLTQERDVSNRRLAAKEAGLPEDFATRLTGESYEDYLADAKSLAALVTPKQTENNNQQNKGSAGDSSTPGNPGEKGKERAMFNRMKAHMEGRAVENPFSPGFQRQTGGGPISSKE